MKKTIGWIAAVAVFVVFLVGAVVLYNRLSADYQPEQLATDQPSPSQTETAGDAASETADEEEVVLAPDFTVLDEAGNEVKLSDFIGQPVVLNFWATWCYYCKEEMPDFNEAYAAHPDVTFLMVNATDGVQETKEMAQAYVAEQGFSFPIYFDTQSSAVSAYSVTGFPVTYFIGKDGSLVAHGRGMLSRENLEQGIAMITEE